MNVPVLLTTFGVIFLAELGDKTQLTAMALATRYPWRRTFVGIALAFFVLNLLAVGVGKALFELVPLPWIKFASAALFLFFGVTTLLSKDEDGDDDEAGAGRKEHGPVLTSFVLIFLAELGDKTQLVTASLAAQHASPVEVFVGSTLALWVVSLMGLLVGAQVGKYVPARQIHRVAGVLFLVFAAVIGYQAVTALMGGS